jgi:curli biogenesis system outer membrane secretion channel CsgG
MRTQICGGWVRGYQSIAIFFAGLAIIAFASVAFAAGETAAVVPQELKVALVIGNSKYTASPLTNPDNDSRAFATKLRTLGFQVIEREDLHAKQIPPTLREFRSILKPGAVALFFYAGHGLQIKGSNYLPAVDADITSEEDVPMNSIDVSKVLDMLGDAKTRLNLVFLDACRNNPYARSFRSSAGGLAKVEAPSGTLISFATRPGSVASDGQGQHGLYTEYLLKAIDEPNIQIEQALKAVVSGVKKTSKGQQEPWMEGSIEGDFYFRGGPTGVGRVQTVADPLSLEVTFWESVRGSSDKRDLQAYVDKYPSGQFIPLALTRIEGLATQQVARSRVANVDKASTTNRRKLVAISGFQNKSTFGSDKLWDTSGQLLTSSLLEMGVFRLVEWEKMKQLFDWKALAANDLVKSPESREKARKILLTEYFLSGAVTHYDVAQKSEVSALSKRKTYVTDVRVDLQMQDSATGEYIGSASGEAIEKQEFTGDFSGGQTGTWDPKSGDKALNRAIQMALNKLVDSYKKHEDED